LRDGNTICRRSWYIAAHVWKIYDFKIEVVPQVMADRGFTVKEDLMVVQVRLTILPSTCGNLAMSSGDVSETSKMLVSMLSRQ
jgi:hypothetical protein